MIISMAREIRSLVRKSVQEAVATEVMRIRATLIPLVSKSEAVNIKKLYKKPTRRSVRSFRVSV